MRLEVGERVMILEPPRASPPRALLIDDPRFDRHIPIGHHPERPQRLTAARAALSGSGVAFDRVEGRMATDEELGRVHDPGFLHQLSQLRGREGQLDPDTYVSPGSVDVAHLAAGSLLALVDAMMDGAMDETVDETVGGSESTSRAQPRPAKGVALLRPPGHHARPAQAMGFCLLNHVAVAAAHARARGLGRVAIVDWDVHHGNGTQEMFWREPGVLYVSTHQFPFYPGTGDVDETGDGEGKGYSVNIPLSAGAGDAAYRAAFERVVLPVVASYAPELILVSAGFDAAERDPLAQMELSADAFGWMARELARIADDSAGGRMALVLEGGYDLVALEAGMKSAIRGMLTDEALELPGTGSGNEEEVARAAAWAKKTWPSVG
ncbi:MAG: histone deacetylase [Myxococcota bacterium]|nr:histone deacetylase [Myxococcota bacterium]